MELGRRAIRILSTRRFTTQDGTLINIGKAPQARSEEDGDVVTSAAARWNFCAAQTSKCWWVTKSFIVLLVVCLVYSRCGEVLQIINYINV